MAGATTSKLVPIPQFGDFCSNIRFNPRKQSFWEDWNVLGVIKLGPSIMHNGQ